MRGAWVNIWLLAPMLLLTPGSEAADFKVKNAQPFISDRNLHVNARLDLPLNARTEEALSKGIPIDIVIEINMLKHRSWWRDRTVTDMVLRRRIQFHALSRQYRVSSLNGRQPAESFGSLTLALAHAGALEEFIIPLSPKKEIEPGARYLLQLRARLDIEALPMLMRPLAYSMPSWRLNTGWTEWPIENDRP